MNLPNAEQSVQAAAPLALSITDTANALGVSASSVRRLIADGTIRSLRIGRRIMVRTADLQAFVDQGAV